AEPGEFTLRALLAGRLDLTQAEAVLGVIDAGDRESLDAALGRMAGGLSAPLHALRAELLSLLADLEAGLDFVEEEDVRFVEAEELLRRLAYAEDSIAAAAKQAAGRDAADRLPRVAIVGPPNVGKSRLFNALTERLGVGEATPSLVADAAGVTRDPVEAELLVGGVRFLLVDTAGDDAAAAIDAIDAAARASATAERDAADLVLRCAPAPTVGDTSALGDGVFAVATMADRVERNAIPTGWLATSAATGEGLDDLAAAIGAGLRASDSPSAGVADHTRTGLALAADALARAVEAAPLGDELVALELRAALDAVGRVVGEVVTDEVLGEVFGRFCIGK
ncbi:MAG: GTPase, partial [Planctomycetota bacterium]